MQLDCGTLETRRDLQMSTFADAIQAKRSIEDRLLAIPGVHTVGVGGKATALVPTGEVAIRVQVTKKGL